MAHDPLAAFPFLRAIRDGSPKQRDFVLSPAKRHLLRAGNRVGKTYSGAAKAWLHVMEPHRRLLVLAANHTSKVAVVGRELADMAPLGMLQNSDYDARRGWRNDLIQLRNGSEILFRSGEAAPTAIAGIEATGAWCDEPPDEVLYGEVTSRVAVTQGPIWLTMTPIGRPVEHLKTRVHGDPDRGIAPSEQWEETIIHLSHEDCPWRSPESIDAQIASYMPWEVPQRVHGAWDGLAADRLFFAFDPTKHIASNLPRADWTLSVAIDHGELAGRQIAILFAYSRSAQAVHILDEYVSSHRTTIEEDAEGIKAMLARHRLTPAHIDHWWGDINSAGKSDHRSINQRMGDCLGVRINPPDKSAGSIMAGVHAINTGFRSDTLFVHRAARSALKALNYWGGKNDDLKHAADALRYGLVPALTHVMGSAQVQRLMVM